MNCPVCGRIMWVNKWKNRKKYVCDWCGVMWWDGSTSTPATQEVFELRKQCHKEFDSIWKTGIMTRANAYLWMQDVMKLSPDRCHIGMFQKYDCEKLLRLLRERK